MLTRKQKEDIVSDLAQKIKTSKSVVISDFKGLAMKDMALLRRELRQNDVDFKVTKKTLIEIALKEAGVDMNVKSIEGQIALAMSQADEVAAPKIIAKLAKVNENLKIMGGLLGTQVLSQEEMMSLSKLPSKEELLAKLVGTLNAPISGFVNVLAGNIRNLINVLNAISQAKQ